MLKTIRPIFKIIIITIIGLGLIFFTNYQLRKWGNELSAGILVDLIERESKGLYELTFERLELNIINKTVRIYNAQLIPNYREITDSTKISNLYQVSIDSADIELQSVFKIYTQNELVVKGVEVVNPHIFMTKVNPEKKAIKFGRETGELYEIIAEYLDLLQIDYFQVRGGGINHSPSMLSLNTINFGIKDFTIDAGKRDRKVFYSEAIQLGLVNQSINLPDSIHVLTFDAFKLSTTDSILTFTNLKIQPQLHINTENSFLKEKQNIYNIIIPILELKGINYLKAYEDNHLLIDAVNIPQPIIEIKSVSGTNEEDQIESENTIGKSLLALFDLVKVKKFRIIEAGLDLTVNISNQQQFKSNNVSIELYDIQLDSNNYRINSRTNYFEHAKISIEEYDYKLPDSLHVIAFKSLDINTFNSTLLINDFKITPSRNQRDSIRTHYNFNIPAIRLTGINYKEALIDKKLLLEQMRFDQPNIIINPGLKSKQASIDTTITPKLIQQELKAYFEEIKAKQITINNGKVSVGDFFFVNDIRLKFDGLVIDTAVNSWHQLADSTALTTGQFDLKMNGSHFTTASIQSGKQLHDFKIENFNMQSSTDTINSKRLSISGVQLDSMIKSSIIQIRAIELFYPEFRINQVAKNQQIEESKWKWPDEAVMLSIQQGKLHYNRNQKNELIVHQFNTQLSYLEQADLKYFNSGNIKFTATEVGHLITIDSLLYEQHINKLSIVNTLIQPSGEDLDLQLITQIPKTSLINFKPELLFHEQELKADSANFEIESFQITGNKYQSEKIKKETEEQFKINFNTLSVNIKNSLVTQKDIQSMDQQTFSSKNLRLVLDGLAFPDKELFSRNSLLFSSELSILGDEFLSINKKQDTILLKKLQYSTIDDNGSIQQLNFINNELTMKVEIDAIQLDHLNLNLLAVENTVELKSLKSKKSNISMTVKDTSKVNISDARKKPFQKLILDDLQSEDINLTINHVENKRKYFVRNASLNMKRIKIDSIFYLDKFPEYIGQLNFNGKNYREEIGEFYTISAADYNFIYPGSQFTAYDVKLKSKYNRFEFSNRIKYQTDWFDLELDKIQLSGLSIQNLINNKFTAEKLYINRSRFIVFRDLKIPQDSSKYVALPQETLLKIKYPFAIDTITVNTEIEVILVPSEGTTLGYLSFADLNGSLYGLRNFNHTNNKPIKLDASGQLNQEGSFKVSASFPMPSEDSEFSIKGQVSKMELSSLNDMLVPIAAVEIRSGMNENLNFSFIGNNEFAKGNMNFVYNNLKVNILNRDTYQTTGLGNNLKTFFANNFVVRSKNPNFFKMHEGDIFYRRDKSRSIFNLWAKSLLSGAVSSIGLSNSESSEDYEEEMQELEEDTDE